MKIKLFDLFSLLTMLLVTAGCDQGWTPTATAIVSGPNPTITPASLVTQIPSTTPTEIRLTPSTTPSTKPGNFSREQLIEDARQLADDIESAHPDPYIRRGGKIAFHRRLQRLLNAIPESGLRRDEFIRLLRPFIAAVGDSHTEIWSDYEVNERSPGGVPLRFGIVEQLLYVTSVPNDLDHSLIGAILISVEGVPLAELCRRQEQLVALENQYHVLEELASRTLWYKPYLQDLLPEWKNTDEIRVELQLPSGEVREMIFALPQNMNALFTPESQFALPTTDDSGFLYDFLDADGKTAYLQVTNMTNYREAEEMAGKPARRLRSVTETFRSMVINMEQAGSDVLIIDLRGNQGGNSVMGDILIYFLYGKETLQNIMTYAEANGGGMIRKYSNLFWEQTQSWTSLEQVNRGRTLPLEADDYDFNADFYGDEARFLEQRAETIAYLENTWLARTPTFWEEYQSEAYSGYYSPGNVLVLTDPWTFSSGFTLARYLYLAGATFIGTPSSQAANSFGNGQLWHLEHTGIEGTVSTTYSVMFPVDSKLAQVLPVDYPLTYEKLSEYDFDPNAEYQYALELLPELKGK
jgi:hypothetical protein